MCIYMYIYKNMSEKPVDQVRWGDTGSVKPGLPLSGRAAWLFCQP